MFTEESMFLSLYSQTDNCDEELVQRINMLIEKAKLCRQLIADYDNLDNKEFYDRLNELGIQNKLEDEDYYEIIGLTDGEEYYGPEEIKTHMYDWFWKKAIVDNITTHSSEKKGLNLLVLYTEDVSDTRYYKEEEIEKLLDENKIVILDKRYATEYPPYINGQPVKCPKYDFACANGYKAFFSERGKYYNETLRYIKQIMNKEVLNGILEELERLLRDAFSNLDLNQFLSTGYQKRIGEYK